MVPTAAAAKLLETGLPELQATQHLAQAGGELPLPDFIQWAKENKIAPNEVLKWGPMRGWLNRVKGDRGASLVLTDQGRAGLSARGTGLYRATPGSAERTTQAAV